MEHNGFVTRRAYAPAYSTSALNVAINRGPIPAPFSYKTPELIRLEQLQSGSADLPGPSPEQAFETPIRIAAPPVRQGTETEPPRYIDDAVGYAPVHTAGPAPIPDPPAMGEPRALATDNRDHDRGLTLPTLQSERRRSADDPGESPGIPTPMFSPTPTDQLDFGRSLAAQSPSQFSTPVNSQTSHIQARPGSAPPAAAPGRQTRQTVDQSGEFVEHDAQSSLEYLQARKAELDAIIGKYQSQRKPLSAYKTYRQELGRVNKSIYEARRLHTSRGYRGS